MAVSDKLKALVDQMPNPDGRGMYTENIDKEKIEKTVAEIHRGGRENVLGLIEMLGEPGSEENVKPHYALHCLANHVLIIKDENARRQFAETVASQLGGELSAYNKAFLCQELQWAGRREAVGALGKLLTDEELCDPAAMALTAIGDGAAEELRRAVPGAKGRCRLAVVDALAALADAGSANVFKEALKDPDREVRLAAGSGLARIGDAGSVDLLLKAADCEPGWERVQQTKHCMVLAEKLAAAGKRSEAGKIYSHLRSTRTDPSERYIRDAAEKALAAT
jgi:HEAT repeat protein